MSRRVWTCKTWNSHFRRHDEGAGTLCFDKRGVGPSTGQFLNVGPQNSIVVFEDLASDMAAGVALLRNLDPKPVLESLDVPGLWVLGGQDRSIPTPATVAILDELIAAGKPYTHVVFPGLGHNLGVANTWPEIDQWLAKTLK